jgi:hypothetical protein
MPARLTCYSVSPSTHVLTPEDDAGTGGALTNSGARSVGGLENYPTETSNMFTMVEIIKVKETVSAPIPGTPPAPIPGSYDGLETAAGPYIKVKSISVPSSYQGDSLSFGHSSSSDPNPSNFMIAPNIKITCTLGSDSSSSGVGFQEVQAVITGPVLELDDWVLPWSDPVAGIPEFSGSDYATTKSAGYGRENGVFLVTFKLEYGCLPFSDGPSPVPVQEKEWTIGIINNATNDRDVYIKKYEEAYGSLTKVPELSERAS